MEGLKLNSSQAEVARWLQVAPQEVFRVWNHFQTSNLTRNESQARHRATIPAEDRYLALSARWLWVDCIFSIYVTCVWNQNFLTNTIRTYSRKVLLCPAISWVRSFDWIQQKTTVGVVPNTSVLGTTRMGACSFQWWVEIYHTSGTCRIFIWKE